MLPSSGLPVLPQVFHLLSGILRVARKFLPTSMRSCHRYRFLLAPIQKVLFVLHQMLYVLHSMLYRQMHHQMVLPKARIGSCFFCNGFYYPHCILRIQDTTSLPS